MFRIGEFAQIAQVSGRMLRHYDQLGLLRPTHVDAESGYRYYSAAQLPRLNRILALNALGVTLEEIGKLIDAEVSPEAMRGMLMMRRAEAAEALRRDEARLKEIEARIAQIDSEGAELDVVVKSVLAQPFLAASCVCNGMEEAVRMVGLVASEAGPRLRGHGTLTVVSRPDFQADALELDIGFALTRPSNAALTLSGGLAMSLRELPAVETMATAVSAGPPEQGHSSFGAFGRWIEANGYEIAGPCREVFLSAMTETEPIIEIQFPLRAAA